MLVEGAKYRPTFIKTVICNTYIIVFIWLKYCVYHILFALTP